MDGSGGDGDGVGAQQRGLAEAVAMGLGDRHHVVETGRHIKLLLQLRISADAGAEGLKSCLRLGSQNKA